MIGATKILSMNNKETQTTEQPQEFLMQFFAYQHLPEHLQKISKPFGDLAEWIVTHCQEILNAQLPCENF